MKRKQVLLLLFGLVLAPFVTIIGFLIAGTAIPIGTFNAAERQKLDARKHEELKKPQATKRQATKRQIPKNPESSSVGPASAEYIIGTEAGTVRVNNLA